MDVLLVQGTICEAFLYGKCLGVRLTAFLCFDILIFQEKHVRYSEIHIFLPMYRALSSSNLINDYFRDIELLFLIETAPKERYFGH